MDSWELYQYLTDICPPIEIVCGVVFLNRRGLSTEAFRDLVGEYENILEAQKWINLVPVDDFLSEAVDQWSIDDANIPAIMEIYSRSWLAACSRAGADENMLHVSCLKDRETGDVAFRLEQRHLAASIPVQLA